MTGEMKGRTLSVKVQSLSALTVSHTFCEFLKVQKMSKNGEIFVLHTLYMGVGDVQALSSV